MSVKRFPAVYVEFKDHASAAGWITASGCDEDGLLCAALGWLVRETKSAIVLAVCDDMNPDLDKANVAPRMYILKSCITKRKKVKV